MRPFVGNIEDMSIRFRARDMRAIEDTITQIRAQAMRGRMSDEIGTRAALQEIVTQANVLTNLLLNGEMGG